MLGQGTLAGGFLILICQASLGGELQTSGPDEEILAERLNRIRTTNETRLRELDAIFQEAGCVGERLSRQPVKGQKWPNLVCSSPGSAPETVIVGAHFDFGGRGTGAIDNWAGASLLPSLFQSLSSRPRRLSFVLDRKSVV